MLLYAYGTGAIKGFALTTGIGILASIITAIVGTQGIYQALLPKLTQTKSLYFWFGVNKKLGEFMELFKQTRILSFMRYSNYGVVVSAILVLLALGLLFLRGFL